jgi:hypothetical protein
MRPIQSKSFQFSDKYRNLLVTLYPAKLLLGYEEPRAHPALALIAAVPTFHVSAYLLNDRER